MFVPGKPFHPNLMFVGKAESLTQVEQLSVYPLLGKLLAFLAIIRLRLKNLQGPNSLAYYKY